MELEERTCKCGCGRKWKSLPTSKNVYFSNEECLPKTNEQKRLEFTSHIAFKGRKFSNREH